MGIQNVLSVMKYGDNWRLSRRMFHQQFNSTTADNFKDVQLMYSRYASVLFVCSGNSECLQIRAALKLIKDYPASFDRHVKYFASGIIMEV